MTRDELIDADRVNLTLVMARAICVRFYETEWEDTSEFRRSMCVHMAVGAREAYEAARPDIAAVLRGGAVVVPREASEAMQEAIVEAAQIYDEWGIDKYVSNPRDVYAAMIAAGEKEMNHAQDQ